MPALRRLAGITLSLGICVVVLNAVGAREVMQTLLDIRPLHLAAALGMVLIDTGLRAANWNQLLNRFTPFRLGKAWLIYLSGGFYGLLIPSTLGTDAARAMTISKRTSLDIRVSAGSLVTLNLLGLGAVATVGTIAAVVLSSRSPTPFLLAGLGFSAILAVSTGILMFTAVGRRLVEVLSRVTEVWPAAQRLLEPLLSAMLVLPRGRRNQLMLVGTALLNQVIRVTVAAIVASSLGITVGWWVLAAIAPMVAIVVMIPLSFFGIGIGQGAMVVILAPFGVTGNEAFAFSLTVAAVYIGQALAGGIAVLFDSAFGSQLTREQGRRNST